MREHGERPTPVLIERELARFERLQAALAAVRAVEEAGGTAHYHSVDLTDAGAVEKVMAQVRDTSGHVDVLLHAAGIEVSHSLPDKEPREFDLVLGVKADGLFNVLHAADELPLGTVVAFSSVAGRFGNVGQTDYSAANDLQCKVLSSLRRTRPDVRTLAIDWTAWGGIGMATRGSIPKIMAAAGVDMLPPEAGVAWIRRELNTGIPDGEVVVAGALGAIAAEFHETGGIDPACLTVDGPMLGEVVRASVHDGLVVRTTLDPTARPFLDHHRIDGTAVLPGVMGMEAFAEAARVLVPDLHVAAVENVDFRAPLKFYRDEPRTLTVTALLRPDGDDLLAECRLSADRSVPGTDQPQPTVHFTGSVRLTSDPPVLTDDEAAPGDDTAALTAGAGLPAVLPRPGLPGGWFCVEARRRRGSPVRRGPAAAGRCPGAHRPTFGGTVLPDCWLARSRHRRDARPAAARRRGSADRSTGGAAGTRGDRAPRRARRLHLHRARRRRQARTCALTGTARCHCRIPPPADVDRPDTRGDAAADETYRYGQTDSAAGHRQPRRAGRPRPDRGGRPESGRDRPPIRTVVLYTDPDADAWYVRQADEAVSLGTATFVDPGRRHAPVALPRRGGGDRGAARRRGGRGMGRLGISGRACVVRPGVRGSRHHLRRPGQRHDPPAR